MTKIGRFQARDVDTAFIERNTGSSAFGSIGFAKIWESIGGQVTYWLIEESGNVVAALPGVEFGSSLVKRFQAMPDGCYANLLVDDADSTRVSEYAKSIVQAITDYKYAKSFIFDFYGVFSGQDSLRSPGSTTIVDISADGWEPQGETLRRAVRTAQKKEISIVRFDASLHLDRFMEFVARCEKEHGRKPKYPRSFYEALATLAESDKRIQWLWSEHDGEPICSHINLVEQDMLFNWQVYVNRELSSLKGNQLMLYMAAQKAKSDGLSRLNLGASPGNSEGLLNYKKSWGRDPRLRLSGQPIRSGEVTLKKNRLRVLLLSDGEAFHTERFLRQLQRQGCHVILLSLEKGSMVHIDLKRRGPIRSLHYLLSVTQIRKIIKRFRPDVISAHYATGYGFTAVLAANISNTPIMLHLWGSDILVAPHKSFLHRYKAASAISGAAAVCADSEYLMKEAEEFEKPSIKQVRPWGIEQEYLKLYRLREHLGSPLKIIAPRPHKEVYDNQFILKALAGLINDGSITITFPSFGYLAGDFFRCADKIVPGRVQYYDRISRSEFIKFMAGHDVYLSNSKSDSSPVSLIEAMGLGLIPIAADIPGVREWLTPQSGFTYARGDACALKRLVQELIDQPETGLRLLQRNHERVKREAVFENNVADQIELMKQISNFSDGS